MDNVLGSYKVLEAAIALLWGSRRSWKLNRKVWGPIRSWKLNGKGFGSYKVLKDQWGTFWGPGRSWKLNGKGLGS